MMYCKHCGKQIDDDSTFCKYCGTSLEKSNNSSEIKIVSFIRKYIVHIGLIVIWYNIGYLYSTVSYDHSDIIFGMYFITPIIMGLLYLLYKQNCKYQIQLFNKSDSTWIKLLKYAYLTYTYFIPFSCSDGLGDDYSLYFLILSMVWLIPTLIICGIYYVIQYRKEKKEAISCNQYDYDQSLVIFADNNALSSDTVTTKKRHGIWKVLKFLLWVAIIWGILILIYVIPGLGVPVAALAGYVGVKMIKKRKNNVEQ